MKESQSFPFAESSINSTTRYAALAPGRFKDIWGKALATQLIEVDQRLRSLGEDASGELYLLTTVQGIPAGQTEKVW